MKDFVKSDFMTVRATLELKLGRKIPMVLALAYYVLMLPLGLVLLPFVSLGAYIYYKIKTRNF